jgi:hypothetical protein
VVFREFCVSWTDDILIGGKDIEEVKTKESLVRERLKGLKENSSKCESAQTSVIFMGFKVTAEGIEPCGDKNRRHSEDVRPKE